MVAAFCALVLAEPDLGTVIAICLVVGAMLLVAGAPVRLLGVSALQLSPDRDPNAPHAEPPPPGIHRPSIAGTGRAP